MYKCVLCMYVDVDGGGWMVVSRLGIGIITELPGIAGPFLPLRFQISELS